MTPGRETHLSCAGYTVISTTYISRNRSTSMIVPFRCQVSFLVSSVLLKRRLLKLLLAPPTGACEKKYPSREEDLWEERLSEHRIRGRIAVSAAGLQGKGSNKRNVVVLFYHRPPKGDPKRVILKQKECLFTDTGMNLGRAPLTARQASPLGIILAAHYIKCVFITVHTILIIYSMFCMLTRAISICQSSAIC